MSERSVAIIGLPESGKTTFLAALWHLVTSREVVTVLRFRTLNAGNATHLNDIAARWRDAKVQDRTSVSGHRRVSMSLQDSGGIPLTVTFPDVPGEAYRRMWEDRDCSSEIAEILKSGGILLFIHADMIRAPKWVVDEVAISREAGLPLPGGEEVQWHPRLSPTQVQLVDLLQLLRRPPIDAGPRRLAVMLSAWDKASGEGLLPQAYLEAKLPLLAQYLRRNVDGWIVNVYGVSAQGGEYDPIGGGVGGLSEAETLRQLDVPATRIRLVAEGRETHDLTEPLAWLMA